jgi:hypothetical protein
VIVAVGSDKGSPGATTLATTLGVVWPGERVLCELDPRGADLPFRLMGANGQHMAAQPSVASLAVAARPGAAAPQLLQFAQPTVWGVPVVRGEVSTRSSSKVAPHLPAIAQLAASWPGAVLADLGSLQPNNPALVVGKAAEIVLLVMRATTEGLGHLRTRVEELSEYVGDPRRPRTPVGVVLVADGRGEGAVVHRTRALLESIGSPAPVVGVFRHDPAGAAQLWAGQVTKKFFKSALAVSAGRLVAEMWQLWPEAMSAFSWSPSPSATASANTPLQIAPAAPVPTRLGRGADEHA